MSLQYIPIDKIRISDLNIRADEQFGDEEDQELVDNIGSVGILQPIVVRAVDDNYEVEIGRRRLLSARQEGLSEVPCIVMEHSNGEAIDASIIENVFRKGVDPVTLGRALRKRLEMEEVSLSEYARRIGKSKSTLSEWIRMTDLSPEVQREVQSGAIPFTYALKIARMDLSEEEQRTLADEASGGFDAFKAAVDRLSVGQKKRGAPKGLLIIRINFGLESPEYDKLQKLAESKGQDVGEYCLNILTSHIRDQRA